MDAGYRLIDTASAYKNEESVGKAIAKCGVPRKELFITSKIWNNAQRLGDVDGAFYRSMERLKLDYLDLYLIHWPVPGCYTGTWLEMAKLLETGRVLSIGVSNFQIHHLEELKKISGIVPAVNQIECHPLCYPKELIEYCQSEGIQVQAYAPLARGAYLDNDVMCVLGTKYAHTPAQSYFPVSIALIACLETFTFSPNFFCVSPSFSRNSFTRFFKITPPFWCQVSLTLSLYHIDFKCQASMTHIEEGV